MPLPDDMSCHHRTTRDDTTCHHLYWGREQMAAGRARAPGACGPRTVHRAGVRRDDRAGDHRPGRPDDPDLLPLLRRQTRSALRRGRDPEFATQLIADAPRVPGASDALIGGLQTVAETRFEGRREEIRARRGHHPVGRGPARARSAQAGRPGRGDPGRFLARGVDRRHRGAAGRDRHDRHSGGARGVAGPGRRSDPVRGHAGDNRVPAGDAGRLSDWGRAATRGAPTGRSRAAA